MKKLLLAGLVLFSSSAFSDQAVDVNKVTCDSQMKIGFFRGNETGTFTFKYIGGSVDVSLQLSGTTVPISDDMHICSITSWPSDQPISVTSFIDDDSWTDIYLNSYGNTDRSAGDAGYLGLRDQNGIFTCPQLPGDRIITLTNCQVQAK